MGKICTQWFSINHCGLGILLLAADFGTGILFVGAGITLFLPGVGDAAVDLLSGASNLEW